MSLSVDENKNPLKLEIEEFIPSTKFTGSKEGYVYKLGDSGSGYYKDTKPDITKEQSDIEQTDENIEQTDENIDTTVIYPLEKYMIRLGSCNSSNKVSFVKDEQEFAINNTKGLLIILFNKGSGEPEDLRLVYPPNIKSENIKYNLDKFTIYDKEYFYNKLEIGVDKDTGVFLSDGDTKERIFNLPDEIGKLLKMDMRAQYYRTTILNSNLYISLISYRNVIPNKQEVLWSKEAIIRPNVEFVPFKSDDIKQELEKSHFIYEGKQYSLIKCMPTNIQDEYTITLQAIGADKIDLAYVNYAEEMCYGTLLNEMNTTQNSLIQSIESTSELDRWYSISFKLGHMEPMNELLDYYADLWDIDPGKKEKKDILSMTDDTKKLKEIKSRISNSKRNKDIENINSNINLLKELSENAEKIGSNIYDSKGAFININREYNDKRSEIELEWLRKFKEGAFITKFDYNLEKEYTIIEKLCKSNDDMQTQLENTFTEFNKVVKKIENNTPKHIRFSYSNINMVINCDELITIVDYYNGLMRNIIRINPSFIETKKEMYNNYYANLLNSIDCNITLDMIQSNNIPKSKYMNLLDESLELKQRLKYIHETFRGIYNKNDDKSFDDIMEKFNINKGVIEEGIIFIEKNIPKCLYYNSYKNYNRDLSTFSTEQKVQNEVVCYQTIWVTQLEKVNKDLENETEKEKLEDLEEKKNTATAIMEKLANLYFLKKDHTLVLQAIHKLINCIKNTYNGIDNESGKENELEKLVEESGKENELEKLVEESGKYKKQIKDIMEEVSSSSIKAGYNILNYIKIDLEESDSIKDNNIEFTSGGDVAVNDVETELSK